jgi:hypothetical protein
MWWSILARSYLRPFETGNREFYERVFGYWGMLMTLSGLAAGFVFNSTYSPPAFREIGTFSAHDRETIFGITIIFSFACSLVSSILSLTFCCLFTLAGAENARALALNVLRVRITVLKRKTAKNFTQVLVRVERGPRSRLRQHFINIPPILLILGLIGMFVAVLIATGGIFTNAVVFAGYAFVGTGVLVALLTSLWVTRHLHTTAFSQPKFDADEVGWPKDTQGADVRTYGPKGVVSVRDRYFEITYDELPWQQFHEHTTTSLAHSRSLQYIPTMGLMRAGIGGRSQGGVRAGMDGPWAMPPGFASSEWDEFSGPAAAAAAGAHGEGVGAWARRVGDEPEQMDESERVPVRAATSSELGVIAQTPM